jgi:hypothetical protein
VQAVFEEMDDAIAALPSLATNALVLGSAAAAGAATTTLRSNDTIAAFDATVPALDTSAGAVGTAAFAARRDHQHPNLVSRTGFRMSDDFMYTSVATPTSGMHIGGLDAYFVSGAVKFSQVFPGTSHAGIATLSTTTTGGVAVLTTSTAQVVCGLGRVRFGWWVMIPVLSIGAQRFSFIAGLFDVYTTATQVDGVFFHYNDSVNSGAWSCTASSNSTTTNTLNVTTGTTVTAGQWYLLEAEINAAGTSVTFYIDGVSTGVTFTTNIPTGAGRETGFGAMVIKTVGSTDLLVHLDAYYYEQDFTTPR